MTASTTALLAGPPIFDPDLLDDVLSLPQPERVRLAHLLIRDIDADECIIPLSRLGSEAAKQSALLMRERFERECG